VHEVDEIRVGTSFTAVTGQRSRKELPLTDALSPKTALLQRTTFLLPSITPSHGGNDEQSPQATGYQPDFFFAREAKWQRLASGHVRLSLPGAGHVVTVRPLFTSKRTSGLSVAVKPGYNDLNWS
jgi:hypothetical protein